MSDSDRVTGRPMHTNMTRNRIDALLDEMTRIKTEAARTSENVQGLLDSYTPDPDGYDRPTDLHAEWLLDEVRRLRGLLGLGPS